MYRILHISGPTKPQPCFRAHYYQRRFRGILAKFRYAIALLGLFSANTYAENLSDLLIVMERDGRTHTVQHTLSASQSTIGLTLPGSVIPQQVTFLGENAQANRSNYQSSPENLLLNNGGMFIRYRHQYGEQIEQKAGKFTLRIPTIPAGIHLKSTELHSSSITWVFPPDLEIVSYAADDAATGNWSTENNTLSFTQKGSTVAMLNIEFQHNDIVGVAYEERCKYDSNNDYCSPDSDNDGVPDYRDVCLASEESVVNVLGCRMSKNTVLGDIVFPTGHNYLDISARRSLDTVAYALQSNQSTYIEIGTHTDNIGSAANNKKLSQKRADAIRHYLLLKGVMPNRVRSVGHGESFPLVENTTASNKRANRRVEVTVLK